MISYILEDNSHIMVLNAKNVSCKGFVYIYWALVTDAASDTRDLNKCETVHYDECRNCRSIGAIQTEQGFCLLLNIYKLNSCCVSNVSKHDTNLL